MVMELDDGRLIDSIVGDWRVIFLFPCSQIKRVKVIEYTHHEKDKTTEMLSAGCPDAYVTMGHDGLNGPTRMSTFISILLVWLSS